LLIRLEIERRRMAVDDEEIAKLVPIRPAVRIEKRTRARPHSEFIAAIRERLWIDAAMDED
jgi:hypothetical protein